MLDASQDDVLSSSPSGDLTTNSSPLRVEEGIESSDESDTDGDTAMSIDDGTAHTINSQDSGSSTHSSLEDRLRQAANQAGTRGIEFDEGGEDMSMEIATGTVTHAFQPWAQHHEQKIDNGDFDDQENVNHFASLDSGVVKDQTKVDSIEETQDETEEMSMDVTKAVGGIVSVGSPGRRNQRSPVSRRKSIRRRRSSQDSTLDQTMEFTVVQGGILGAGTNQAAMNTPSPRQSDGDKTMEFTSVVGGVVGNIDRRSPVMSEPSDGNQTMDMTIAVGGILAPIEEHTEPQSDVEEQTMAMDMTRAVGGILARNQRVTRQSLGNQSVANPGASINRLQDTEPTTPESTPKPQHHIASVASETGSPSLALKPRLSGRSQKSATKPSTTPQASPQNRTPVKSANGIRTGTPSKQLTPLPARAETPNKTPLSASVTHRGASPKKLFKAEIKARASPASAKREATLKTNTLFSRDAETGHQTPSVILRAPKPQLIRRRSSGLGIDKDGIGSPKVSELLDRRSSIGDAAPEFKLGDMHPKELRFQDVQQLEHEVDAERADEHRRESGRFIMEQEADEHQEENATYQLKDMIQAMSPPKKTKSSKLKGRKSLAVGTAKGLLGKRPAELDMDEDDEADSTPKRLRVVSREGSPVKNVHLPKPPSKDETTGRLSTRLQKSLQEMASAVSTTPTTGPGSPRRNPGAASPAAAGRFKDVQPSSDARPESFEDKLDNVVGAINISTAQMQEGSDRSDQDKISLQQFLNMTNIHFIELSTTKRRHTIAQSLPVQESEGGVNDTESNFIAAATTLPLLELYQHATRELKSYISTGRKIIRSIEAETLAEQPPLFREYLDARPDVKLVMDNQFRNGKANARLQSKEGWYQWRAQLVDGLKAGLDGINMGLNADLELLRQQQQILEAVVPQLLQERSDLQDQKASLKRTQEELDSVDHEALKSCREELKTANEQYLERSALLEALQRQMREKDEALLAANELKTEMIDQIAEADRVREEHKGLPVADVLALKTKVEQIEKQTGWQLVAAEEEVDEPNDFGAAVTMMYKNVLRLFFYPQVFQCQTTAAPRRRSGRKSASTSGPTAPISLTFAPTDQEEFEATIAELPTEKRFFLQMIRSQLHVFAMMPKGSIPSKTLLLTVSQGWDNACKVSEELRLLSLVGITTASILSDEKLGVKVMLMTRNQGRIDVEFLTTVTILNDGGIVTSTGITANAVYGPAMNLLSGAKGRKVQHALGKEIDSRTLGDGAWANAIHGFEEWLCGQGKSKQEPTTQERMRPEEGEYAPPPPPPHPTSAAAPTPAAATTVTTSSSAPKRSPLAPKRTNVVQKKALPIPKQRLDKSTTHHSHHHQHHQQSLDKENFNPSLSTSSGKLVQQQDTLDWETSIHTGKPAIPPEIQEASMITNTPIKRVGALRRSPI